jgi:hypothetical protein
MKPPTIYASWAACYESDRNAIATLQKRIETLREYQRGRVQSWIATGTLARLLGVSRSHASDLRSGRRNLTDDQSALVSAHLKSEGEHTLAVYRKKPTL